MDTDVARYMLFKDSASRGLMLKNLLNEGDINEDQLTSTHMLDIRTYQFNEYWLSTYNMNDIPWIRCQF